MTIGAALYNSWSGAHRFAECYAPRFSASPLRRAEKKRMDGVLHTLLLRFAEVHKVKGSNELCTSFRMFLFLEEKFA